MSQRRTRECRATIATSVQASARSSWMDRRPSQPFRLPGRQLRRRAQSAQAQRAVQAGRHVDHPGAQCCAESAAEPTAELTAEVKAEVKAEVTAELTKACFELLPTPARRSSRCVRHQQGTARSERPGPACAVSAPASRVA